MAEEKQEIPKPKQKENSGIQLVRILRRDLPGNKKIETGLRKIKGINYMMAKAIRVNSGFDKNRLLQDLTESEVSKLEGVLENISNYDIPAWMLNRNKDPDTGETTHKFESDLQIQLREDLTNMKKLKSYRGIRHINDLPVRGQRTKSTGRKNKTIGRRSRT